MYVTRSAAVSNNSQAQDPEASYISHIFIPTSDYKSRNSLKETIHLHTRRICLGAINRTINMTVK